MKDEITTILSPSRNCWQCVHCEDLHEMTEIIHCAERKKNNHPNYAQQCDSFESNKRLTRP